MDFSILSHIIAISEEKSISKAAERLFITRSALNKQLLSIESELGAPLFKRIYNTLELTDIGRLYVEFAKELCDLKRECDRTIYNYLAQDRGDLRLGISKGHADMLLNGMLPEYHRLYPNVTIKVSNNNSNELYNLLSKGNIDIAVLSVQDITDDFHCEILDDVEMLLVVPRDHPLAHLGGRGEDGYYRQCDLKWFENDYFGMEDLDTPGRHLNERIFVQNNITPKIFIENCDYSMLIRLANSGTCLCIEPETHIKNQENLIGFGLNPRRFMSYVIARRKDYNLCKYEKRFIEMIKESYYNYRYSN